MVVIVETFLLTKTFVFGHYSHRFGSHSGKYLIALLFEVCLWKILVSLHVTYLSLYSNKSKTVIFMINLALADLAHILSLPLRIYYYFTHTWPFGRGMCLFCFYLKYLNMYAAIVFLVSKQ